MADQQATDGANTTESVSAEAEGQQQAATTEVVAEGQQAAAETPKAEETPQEIEYEFELPENYEFDADIATDLKAFAKEKNLSKDEAQKLVDLGVKMRVKEAEAFQNVQQQWVEQVKSDKEIGGAQLDQNIAVAKQALDAFGTPELRNLLNSTGFGNHPEVVRAFYKIGKAISEDKLVSGGNRPKPATKDAAKTLFPNQS